MAGDGLRLAGLAYHEQLGKNGHRFQVDGECPQNLKGSKLMVDKESQTSDGYDQELNAESIVVAVVGSLELVVHQEQGKV